MADCLGVVPLGVEHKRTAVIRVVVRAQSGRAVVSAAGGERRPVELVDRCPILRDDRNVQRFFELSFIANPEIGFATGAEPGGRLSVQRVWRAHKLQPHRLRTFKRSRDPSFATKLTDIVGLYLDPPAHAVVLSIEEKSQIQALDRTQPGLPIKPGRCQTMTHDYKRHGTTTLFVALSVLDGTVIGRCMQRHRHIEFIRFLNTVERQVSAGKLIHVVLDNHATHKHPKVLAWLARHPRWTFHFTPTSASWLNVVENFFSKMTRLRIRRGVFHSIADLQAAINAYLVEQ